jgi:flotillin
MEKLKSASAIFQEQNAIGDLSYEQERLSDDATQQSLQQPGQNQQSVMKRKSRNFVINNLKTSEDLQLEKESIKVKITGMIWKKVIVPPNVYVVQTRIHRKEPVTIGLGISFRYNPATDSFLIVPAAMQTIGVVANCISREKQGINILAYVQWQIEDFSIAYKKLDFSDSRDPLAIVNAQLREQAEAAIKDKISTMSVEDVLTDKVLIMEELTKRLKIVAEGQSDGLGNKQEGLGIKIITVQIREALVSSETLWEYLQSPFRNEQYKKSNVSYIQMQDDVNKKELEARKEKETREAQTNTELEIIKQKKQTELIEMKLREDSIRYEKEQNAIREKLEKEEEYILNKKASDERISKKESEIKLLQMEAQRVLNEKEFELKTSLQQREHELEKLKLEADLLKEKLLKEQELFMENERNKISLQYEEEYAKISRMKQEIANIVTDNSIMKGLVEKLPEIARNMPKANEMKIFHNGEGDPMIDNLILFINKIIEIFKGANGEKK